MHRKWKSVAALSMAVLLGCLMPMDTMLAADDETEVVQEVEADSDSDADVVSDDEAISEENESTIDEVDAADENANEEINADDENIGDDANAEDESVADEADVVNDENVGIEVMAETEEPQAGDIEVQADTAAPVINITVNGESCIDDQGDNINYKYTNNPDSKFDFSVSLNGTPITFRYYLDKNPGDKAKDNNDITWSDKCSAMELGIPSNSACVLYVKAEANGQTVYARSCGIAVDTIAPKIVGVEAGKTYPEGTSFTVEDANLDVVMVNESPATPASDGSYRVKANGTNCLIRAKDKAGNEGTCSIIVFGKLPVEEPEDPTEDPVEDPVEDPIENPTENTVISASGTYSLKTGTSYQLAAGTWQIDGDKTVYQGGRAFYVKAAGDYTFKKR